MLSLPAVQARSSLLKLDLYCRGLLVDNSCRVGDDDGLLRGADYEHLPPPGAAKADVRVHVLQALRRMTDTPVQAARA